MTNAKSKATQAAEGPTMSANLDKHLNILESLFKDVTGNLSMGDFKNAASYLKSIGLLAAALSRQCQQEFELGLIDEIEELPTGDEVAEALVLKRKLNHRELQFSALETALTNYLALVGSRCFLTAKDAANSLRSVATDIEQQEETELFPKPMTDADMRAWAAQHGIKVIDATKSTANTSKARRTTSSKSAKSIKSRSAAHR